MKKIFFLMLLFCTGHIASWAQLGVITTVAGTGVPGHSGDFGMATAAELNFPHGLAISPLTGYVYMIETYNDIIRKIDPATGIIYPVAGTGVSGYNGDGVATATQLNRPFDLVIDASDNIYFCDRLNHRVRKIDGSTGMISTIAGNGSLGYGGEGVAAISVPMDNPCGIAMDAAGDIFISERHRIRKISGGIITTIGGIGVPGYSGDGVPVSSAVFSFNNFLTFDNAGNLLVSDNGNHCVRCIKKDPTMGIFPGSIIVTIAGIPGMPGNSGDGSPATGAMLNFPGGLKVDVLGNLYIAGNENNSIRKIELSGNISTVAGTGTAGYSGDGGAPLLAMMNTPRDFDIDASGNVYYLTDAFNHRLRSNRSDSFFVCKGSCVKLHAIDGVSYSWSPSTGLSATNTQSTSACPSSTTTYTVTITDALGGTTTQMFTVVVNTLPAPITGGGGPICVGGTLALSNPIPGGSWYSDYTAVAAVDESTGVVTGVSAGVANIRYMLRGGCSATQAVTVSGIVLSGVHVCQGITRALVGIPAGGTWTSSNTAIATVNASTGVVGGVVTGSSSSATVTITYTVGSCTDYTTVTVDPVPVITPLSGAGICVYSTTALTATPSGGTWSSSNTSVAIVDPISGLATAGVPGTTIITYSIGCGVDATLAVTVSGADAILGRTVYCNTAVGGGYATGTLTCSPGGGTWSSSNTAVAVINSTTGVVTAVSGGVATITYTLASGCNSTANITVNTTTDPEYDVKIAEIDPFELLEPGSAIYMACSTATGNSVTLSAVNGSIGGTFPSTATYAWSGPTGTIDAPASQITNVTLSSAATYTVRVTDGCIYKATARVVVSSAQCTPCNFFHGPSAAGGCTDCNRVAPFHTYTANTIDVSSFVDGENYFLIPSTNVVTFGGSGTLNNDIIFMNQGSSININSSSAITLSGTHIAGGESCGWAGIRINATTVSVGKLVVGNNSLIEYQNVSSRGALTFDYGTTTTLTNIGSPSLYDPSTGENSIIISKDAIYNSNVNGMYLNYYPDEAVASTILPFRITNSVFSRANFTNYGSGASLAGYYPFSWPSVTALKTVTSASEYNPVYDIDQYGAGLSQVNIGIRLKGGFTKIITESPMDNEYRKYLIGGGTDESNSNLFYNLNLGIYASDANVSVYNSTFKLAADGVMPPHDNQREYSGICIQNFFKKNWMLSVGDDGTGTETGVAGCKFYNMTTGIYGFANGTNSYGWGYADISIRGCTFSSKRHEYLPTSMNNVAVLLDVYRFSKMILSDNNVYNTFKGFDITCLNYGDISQHGAVAIKNNYFGASHPSSVLPNGRIRDAIYLYGQVRPAGSSFWSINDVEILGNTCVGVDNAIQSDFKNKIHRVDNNVLGVKVGGIKLQNINYGGEATGNEIGGPGYSSTNTFGIYSSQVGVDKPSPEVDSPFSIICNNVHDINLGFQFAGGGSSSYLNWRDNVMEHCSTGMYLATRIGIQGGSGDPINNYWSDMNWWNTTAGVNQTFVTASGYAAGSLLHVVNFGGVSLPSINAGPFPYNSGTLNTVTGGTYPTCTGLFDGALKGISEENGVANVQSTTYTLYPNPTTGAINIEHSGDKEVNVRVLNAVGETVYTNVLDFTTGIASMQLSNVATGLYLVELTNATGQKYITKVMVQQ